MKVDCLDGDGFHTIYKECRSPAMVETVLTIFSPHFLLASSEVSSERRRSNCTASMHKVPPLIQGLLLITPHFSLCSPAGGYSFEFHNHDDDDGKYQGAPFLFLNNTILPAGSYSAIYAVGCNNSLSWVPPDGHNEDGTVRQ